MTSSITDYDNTILTITLAPDKLRDEITKLKQYRELAGRIYKDAIEARRDAHIDALEQQMHQKSSTQRWFTLRWRLV